MKANKASAQGFRILLLTLKLLLLTWHRYDADGLSFLSFLFPCFWLCTVLFAPILAFFPFVLISHFFPFSSSLNLFANNKRDKKMVRVSFSLTFPPSSSRCFGWYGFVYVRIRLREAFARVASLAKAEGSARIFLGRSIWREKLLSVSVCLSKCAGLAGVNTKLERTVRRCNQSKDEIFVSFTSLFAWIAIIEAFDAFAWIDLDALYARVQRERWFWTSHRAFQRRKISLREENNTNDDKLFLSFFL